MEQINCKYLIGNRFIFSPHHHSLVDNTQPEETLYLGINESRALHRMLTEPGTIISRQHMHDYIWREQGFEVDDSSLTQAISTLRKYLQDSTRSPAYIKTIPKRGYQIIASVDRIDDILVNPAEPACSAPALETPDAILDAQIIMPASAPPTDEPDDGFIPAGEVLPVVKHPRFLAGLRQPRSLLSLITVLLLCLVLPVWAYLSPPPSSSDFNPVFRFLDIPVLAPSESQITPSWHPLIRQCITAHLPKNHNPASMPAKIIVTGGEHNQLWMNLIYKPAHYKKNMTLTIVTLDKERELPCQIQ